MFGLDPPGIDTAGAADEILNEGSRFTPKSRRLVTREDGPSATAPETHAPAATAATETPSTTAATVMVWRANCHRQGGCVPEESPSKSGGVCTSHLSPTTQPSARERRKKRGNTHTPRKMTGSGQ